VRNPTGKADVGTHFCSTKLSVEKTEGSKKNKKNKKGKSFAFFALFASFVSLDPSLQTTVFEMCPDISRQRGNCFKIFNTTARGVP